MKTLESGVELVVNLLMWLACFVGFVMMMHISVDVAGRVLFNHPFAGTTEVASAYYMVAVSFLPLAYVSRHEGQIFVELFTRGLAARNLLRLDALVNVVAFVYMALFTWKTGAMAVEQTRFREIWDLGDHFLDIWPSRWLLPVSFGAATLYALARVVEDIRRARRG